MSKSSVKNLLDKIMNTNDIDSYRLDTLQPIYGREIEYRKDEQVSVKCLMFACEDMTISNQIELEFIFPLNFHSKGGMSIFTSNPAAFAHTQYYCDGTNKLTIPMFENAKYPLGVWFFTLRYSLLKERDPWITPFELCRSLPIPCRRIGGGNIQNVCMISGAGRTRGRRSYMEDVDFAFDSIRVNERYSVSAYGVLDGHGGQECAKFAVDDIPMKLATYLRSGMACNEAIHASFLSTDAEFLKSGRSTAGSTACVLVWDPSVGAGYIANTGDTRAVMSRSGRAIELSRDKKATNHEEIARVCLGGGFVVNGRVLGSLAVSRALGDAQLKQPGKRTVIPDPDVTTFRPNACTMPLPSGQEGLDIDEFIIIATDGLWDVMSSQEAVDYVRDAMMKADLMQNESMPASSTTAALDQIGEQLAQHAVKNLSSLDNVTVMIIRINIRNPNIPVPDTLPLEGWQWSRNLVSNSRSGSRSGSMDQPISSESGSMREPYNSSSSKQYFDRKDLGDKSSAGGASCSGSKLALESSQKMESVSKRCDGIAATSGNSARKDAEEDTDMLEFLLDDNNF